jgi:hypothetical protein
MLAYLKNHITSFIDRNKYRLVGSAVVVGGVWYYYRDTIQQAWTMYKLLQEVQEEEAPLKADRNDAYMQTIATGDETSEKHLQQIRLVRADLYGSDLERVQSNLKQNISSNREELFSELNSLCFSRLLLSILSVSFLLLLARIDVCLIGRANRRQVSEEDKADHRELLAALRTVSSKDTLQSIDVTIRKNFDLSPTKVVSSESLRETLFEIVEKCVSDLKRIRSAGSDFGWLLGRLETDSQDQSKICRETLDVLESPQFVAVLTHCVKQGLVESLKRSSPKNLEKSFPVAALIPGVKAEAESVTSASSPQIAMFKSAPIVDEFCLSVYLADDSRDDLALLNKMPENDPNMAKLGELLEKLVKADMNES